MSVLPRRQVTVEFGNTLEHRYTRQGLHDLEDLLDLGLHVNEGCLAAVGFCDFARIGKDSQASTTDKLEAGQVKDEVFDGLVQEWRELGLQFRGGSRVEAPGEFYRDRSFVLRGDVLLDLDF